MELAPFLQRARILEDGFASVDPAAAWRLGGVVLARSGGQVAVVQKAERPGYEFSGKWAFPGGMIRSDGAPAGSPSNTCRAASQRASIETGLQFQAVTPQTQLGPIVTSYTAKGSQRFTLVAAFACEHPAAEPLRPSDDSIKAAAWLPMLGDLADFAPANCLILAHLVWRDLDPDQQLRMRARITAALRQCSAWAAQVGVAAPVAPWASEDELAAWRRTWPCRPEPPNKSI